MQIESLSYPCPYCGMLFTTPLGRDLHYRECVPRWCQWRNRLVDVAWVALFCCGLVGIGLVALACLPFFAPH